MSMEDWKIACHEAGHAIAAARHGIIIEHVAVGPNEFGEVAVIASPISDPDQFGSDLWLQRYQEFYAAGAAAERVVFLSERFHATRHDRDRHGRIEKMRPQPRICGFETDIQAAMNIVDRNSILSLAMKLQAHGSLDHEAVARLVDAPIPWDHSPCNS